MSAYPRLTSARFATRPLKIKSADLILKRRCNEVSELPRRNVEANDTEFVPTRIRLQDDLITGVSQRFLI